jgi:hypothetical protein
MRTDRQRKRCDDLLTPYTVRHLGASDRSAWFSSAGGDYEDEDDIPAVICQSGPFSVPFSQPLRRRAVYHDTVKLRA